MRLRWQHIGRGLRFLVAGLLLLVLAAVSGCAGGSSSSSSYTVSGRITQASNPQLGIAGVTLLFSGGYGIATTDADGRWSKSGLKGTVTITPNKEGWTFNPGTRQVSGAASNIDFSGTPLPPMSSDFMGLETGACWVYDERIVVDEQVGEFQFLLSVLSEEEEPGKTVFKLGIDFGDGFKMGEYWGRMGDAYYFLGAWSTDPPQEQWVEPELLVVNPINPGDLGFGGLSVIGREQVAVPAGIFDAWLFYDDEQWNEGTIEWRIQRSLWFTPYIGVVKSSTQERATDPNTGETVSYYEYTLDLAGYDFSGGLGLKSSSLTPSRGEVNLRRLPFPWR